MLKIFPLIICTFIIVGCVSSNVQTYSSFDQDDKTITVPPGAKGLKGKLKSALNENGWSLAVYSGPSRLEGTLGPVTSLASYDTFNTRYTLFVAARQFDLCLNLQPMIDYDISLIDNKTGSEIITMDGRDCENAVASKFISALSS